MKRRDFILGLGGAALFANSARDQQNSDRTAFSHEVAYSRPTIHLGEYPFSEIADAYAAQAAMT